MSDRLKFLHLLSAEFDELVDVTSTLRRYKNFAPDSSDADTFQNALNLNVVISYARNFTECKGFNDIKGIRKALKKNFSKEEKELHKSIMDLRNEAYAHSDSKAHDIQIIDDEFFTFSKLVPRQQLSQEVLELLSGMVVKIREKIEELIANHKKVKK